MQTSFLAKTIVRSVFAVALLGSAAMIAAAQTPTPAATPVVKRMADGHPDLSGAWTRGGVMGVPGPGIRAINDARGICVINCGPAPDVNAAATPGAKPAAAPPRLPAAAFPNYKPEFRDKVAKLNKEQVKYDPALRCVNPGLPRIGPPKKIMQSANQVVFLYDDLNGAFWRIIPTDGRPHRDDAEDSYLGDSVGHWEGDKLVIETISFNAESWLTDNGAFHTSKMKVIEEIGTNGAQLDYKLTVHDPDVLAEPWVKSATMRVAAKELLEPVPCIEQSIGKMTGIESYHPNPRW
jgi:hypothetical protein